MADVFTKQMRSAIMARVKGADTKPEHAVRSTLHRMGYRFRLHRADLPGKPDIVLPKLRTAVFVHGCFWHGHAGCEHAARPTSNTAYWNKKLDRNTVRDRANARALRLLGWKPVVVWECLARDPLRLCKSLTAKLARSC